MAVFEIRPLKHILHTTRYNTCIMNMNKRSLKTTKVLETKKVVPELNVNKVGLRTIRLPIRIEIIISQLINTKARLAR